MDNEVKIKVHVDDDTDRGFLSARQKSNKTASDIEGEFKKAGPKIGDSLGGGIFSGLKASLPEMGQVLPMIGAAAAPLIGAAISGAIIGGAGIGGVLGGVYLVSKDPRIAAAGQEMGKNLMSSLKADAAPFLQPVMTAIRQIQMGFDAIEPHIKNIFANASKFVQPLTQGLVSGISAITRGIDSLIANGGPVIKEIGASFDTLGTSIGGAMQTIAGGGPEAASAIHDLAAFLGDLITVIGWTVRGLTELFNVVSYIPQKLHDFGMAVHDAVLGSKIQGDVAKTTSAALAQQSSVLHALTGDTNKQTSAVKRLSDEMQAQTDPLFAMIKGQEDVTKAQSDYNDALKKHGPRSQQAKDAMVTLGEAAFGLNSKVDAAAGSFDGRLTPAMRTALHNAGLSKAQMDRLEASLRNAASAADAWAGTYTQNLKTIYSSSGREAVDLSGHRVGGYQAHGGIVGAAANGATSNGLTMTGEHGPELLDLPPGTRVHSAPDTQRMVGAGRQALDVTVRAAQGLGHDLIGVLLQALQLEIRAQGGNVQQVLGQPGR